MTQPTTYAETINPRPLGDLERLAVIRAGGSETLGRVAEAVWHTMTADEQQALETSTDTVIGAAETPEREEWLYMQVVLLGMYRRRRRHGRRSATEGLDPEPVAPTSGDGASD